jgi:hypothetical protein
VRRRPSHVRKAAFAVCLGALALAGDGFTLAEFSGTAASPANRVTAAADFRAPTVDSSTILKAAGGTPGFVKQGGAYRVYANVADTGNPASGVGAVTADVSTVTPGATAAALTPGSFTAGGVAYGFRSAELIATAPLPEGAKPYSLSATDNASNGPTRGDFAVTVDNTAPSGTDVQTANLAATVARPETGDTLTFTFSEPIDPASILAGWTGNSTGVVVRIVNAALAAPDTLQVHDSANSAQLPVGGVDLGASGYVGGLLGGETALFGATGTASTMTLSGSTVTIVLGTASGQAATTALLNNTMTWTPSATATDRAGSAGTTTAVDESGAADREF